MIKDSEYGAYYSPYVSAVKTNDIGAELTKGLKEVSSFFEAIPQDKQMYSYAAGKWTPKEVFVHLIDCERVFMYRAMQIARSKDVDLEGFDQDEFVANSNANARTMDSLLNEYAAVRSASIQFIENCEADTLTKMGKASNSPLSARAAAYITRGHEMHHIKVLKEKYL